MARKKQNQKQQTTKQQHTQQSLAGNGKDAAVPEQPKRSKAQKEQLAFNHFDENTRKRAEIDENNRLGKRAKTNVAQTDGEAALYPDISPQRIAERISKSYPGVLEAIKAIDPELTADLVKPARFDQTLATADPDLPVNPLCLIPPKLRVALETRFDINHTHVSGNTNIGAKARTIIAIMHPTTKSRSQGLGNKPTLIVLTSTAKTANKEVSIAEIVKRELNGLGMRVWQYTGLASRVEKVSARETEVKTEGAGLADEGNEDVEELAFEIMEQQSKKAGDKVRSMPVLTIWLSSCEIREIEKEYGVQVSLEKNIKTEED
jgi:hypothetical protein